MARWQAERSGAGQRIFRAWRVPVAVSLVVSALVAYAIRPVAVVGTSMQPTLASGEYLMATRADWIPLNRGDLVVLRFDNKFEPYLVKRVVAIPGDRVRVLDFTVWVNDQRLSEPYVKEPWTANEGYLRGNDVRLGSDEYFLLGDNRDLSLDSRTLGPQPRARIVDKVWLRTWPLPRLAALGGL
jgi:signal peptidase I